MLCKRLSWLCIFCLSLTGIGTITLKGIEAVQSQNKPVGFVYKESLSKEKAMGMNRQIMPMVTFSDTPKEILNYLVQRTANTVGKQVKRSPAVVVGKVQTSEVHSLAVRLDQAAVLQPWLSGEAGVGPKINIEVTNVEVERWLVGSKQAKQLNIVYPYLSRGIISEPGNSPPIFSVEDRGILFLQEIPSDVPYISYLPQPAYQLAPGEKWVHNFLVTDYNQTGEKFTRNETDKVEEMIAAVQWYAALPGENSAALHQALLDALNSPNPRVVREAIRELAYEGNSTTAEVFKQKLQGATEDLQIRLMLGLWIIGEQEFAQNMLERLFQEHGKYLWLAHWQIQATLDENKQPIAPLYGPDPSEYKED